MVTFGDIVQTFRRKFERIQTSFVKTFAKFQNKFSDIYEQFCDNWKPTETVLEKTWKILKKLGINTEEY